MEFYNASDSYEKPRTSFSRLGSMDSNAVGSEVLPSIKSLDDRHPELFYTPRTQTHTPASSASGSPSIKPESTSPCNSRGCSPLPSIAHMSTQSSPSLRLPSLVEFDQGVQALVKSQGPVGPVASRTPSPPLPSITRPLRAPLRFSNFGQPTSYQNYSLSGHQSRPTPVGIHGYPTPPPDGENRHINQKYTQEEGDFIIYAWHDKKLKWQRIKQEFASMFGRTPERTVQGLQAWYYRMNQRIPVWDQDGWLIFDNDDDLEPRQVSIKCRDKDGQDKPMEPLGLGQRYPERAVCYPWVDPELKRKSQDWAVKREIQYRERKERRKRKEQRRLKL